MKNLNVKKSDNQLKLYGHEKIFDNLIKLYDSGKLPKKILFSGPKGVGKSTMAHHLANYIFSQDEDFNYNLNDFEINPLNKSYKLMSSGSHPNFYLIDVLNDKNFIEISQIREMINYTNKSSFNNKEKIILIDNAENLNLFSSNALLKLVEEPNDKLIIILVFDNKKKILDTLKSRCTAIYISLNFDKCVDVFNKIFLTDIYKLINKDLIHYYNTTGDLINLYQFSIDAKIDLSKLRLNEFLSILINEKYYKKNDYIKKNIYAFVELYLFQLFTYHNSKHKISNIYKNFVNKINNLKKFNLDEESFFIEFNKKIFNE